MTDQPALPDGLRHPGQKDETTIKHPSDWPEAKAELFRIQDVARHHRTRAKTAEDERGEARAALERVRELHRPTEGLGYDSDEDDTPGSYGHIAQVCTSCGTASEYGVRWPCPTIRAIDAEPAREVPR